MVFTDADGDPCYCNACQANFPIKLAPNPGPLLCKEVLPPRRRHTVLRVASRVFWAIVTIFADMSKGISEFRGYERLPPCQCPECKMGGRHG
jgi:hypothetical protein